MARLVRLPLPLPSRPFDANEELFITDDEVANVHLCKAYLLEELEHDMTDSQRIQG